MFHLFHKQLLLLLSPLALGDIPGNFGGPDDPSISIFERRYRQRNVDETSVLAATDRIVMINPLAPAYARKNFRFLTHAIWGNQDRDRLADGLFRLVAEQPLGTAIPTCDDAVKVLADNRIV